MTATVYQLPGATAPPAEGTGLNLSPTEVQDAAGGYKRPADQLQELHRRGFARAYRRAGVGPVILERAHYDAVVRGQFGHGEPAAQEPERPAARFNRAGAAKLCQQKGRK